MLVEAAPVVAVAAEVVHEAAAEGGAPARRPAKCRRATRLEGVEQALVHLPHEKHRLNREQANKTQRSCLPAKRRGVACLECVQQAPVHLCQYR